MMSSLTTDRDTIGIALGRIPSGCSILTTTHDGKSTGLLVSWVQQASFEPLMLTVCIKEERPATKLIAGSGKFLLNVIGENPTAMFKHFGKGFALDEDAFVGLTTHPTDFGPTLEGCIAHLGCQVKSKVTSGDHDIYLAEIMAGQGAKNLNPYTHIRNSGLSY